MKVSVSAKKYFWEVEVEKLDPQKNAEYIIGRLLEYGDIEAVRWMFHAFDRELITHVLMNKRGFSRVTANLFFDLNKKDVLCLKKPYQKSQKTHWPY
jgi:hypothetical protein